MDLINKIVFIVLIGSILFGYYQLKQNQYYKNKYNIEAANYKALALTSENKNRVLQLTIDQLEYQNDSLLTKIDSLSKKLKIKPKQVETIIYEKQYVNVGDTIVLKDSIFNINLDTTLINSYRKLELKIREPSTIIDNLEVYDDSYIIIYLSKETIKPPKKFFLTRLFQKKHVVYKYEITHSNPYIETKESSIIKIIN